MEDYKRSYSGDYVYILERQWFNAASKAPDIRVDATIGCLPRNTYHCLVIKDNEAEIILAGSKIYFNPKSGRVIGYNAEAAKRFSINKIRDIRIHSRDEGSIIDNDDDCRV